MRPCAGPALPYHRGIAEAEDRDERLPAILVAAVAGYSRLMRDTEAVFVVFADVRFGCAPW